MVVFVLLARTSCLRDAGLFLPIHTYPCRRVERRKCASAVCSGVIRIPAESEAVGVVRYTRRDKSTSNSRTSQYWSEISLFAVTDFLTHRSGDLIYVCFTRDSYIP